MSQIFELEPPNSQSKEGKQSSDSSPNALGVIFLIQENLHLWKLEGQHRLCHAGAGGHDREVRDRRGVIGRGAAPVGGRGGIQQEACKQCRLTLVPGPRHPQSTFLDTATVYCPTPCRLDVIIIPLYRWQKQVRRGKVTCPGSWS